MGDLAKATIRGLGAQGVIQPSGTVIFHFPAKDAVVGGAEWKHLKECASREVAAILDGQAPTIYKIGITSDPRHRWGNFSYGYFREFSNMRILAATTPTWAASLERHLIHMFKLRTGCRNIAPGGENTPREGPVYVYVVYVSSDEYTDLRLKRMRIANGGAG
jgi:hypothetical protein